MGPLLRKKPFCSFCKTMHIKVILFKNNSVVIIFLIPSKNTSLSHQIRSSLTWIFDTDSSPCVVSLSYLYSPSLNIDQHEED